MPRGHCTQFPGHLQIGFWLGQVEGDGKLPSRGSHLLSSLLVKDLLVKVTESFENTQRISSCQEPNCSNPACFHYPKYFQPRLHVEMPKSHWNCGVLDNPNGGEGGAWGRWGLPEEPLPPSQSLSFLPALLLLHTQEWPCLPAP